MTQKFKMCLKTSSVSSSGSAALLVLRLIVGIAFLHHGWGKIQNPMGWMPPEAGVPGFFQLLAAVSEFGGGLALIVGFLTRIAMIGLGFTMLIATSMHALVMKDPFVATGPGMSSFELPLVFLGICLVFLALGPGKYSLDQKVFGQK